jgi:hypothetical protein
MADINLGRGLLDWLVELIKADYPDNWVREAQGTLETRRLEPRQIRAGALRFDPDERCSTRGSSSLWTFGSGLRRRSLRTAP